MEEVVQQTAEEQLLDEAPDGRPDGNEEAPQSRWKAYRDAELGFRNHWYPAMYSKELLEDEPVGVTLLAENVLLTRVNGVVMGVRDRCAHRGVRFSERPLCFTKGTVTCWYHSFTYDLESGRLCDIPIMPGSAVIGRISIDTYHVQEAKGIVFVFIGDGDPPPLEYDVPEGFLSEDTHALGIRRLVHSNWRLGAENGADISHIFIHRDSVLLKENNILLPPAFMSTGGTTTRVVTDGWPKGIVDRPIDGYLPVWEAKVGDTTILSRQPTGHEKFVAEGGGLWLPCCLKIAPWPDPGLAQYEWYVPVTEGEHMYFQVITKPVASPADVEVFEDEFETRWVPLALHGFNDDDIMAREAMEDFYRDEDGWSNERLYPPDANLLAWRRLANHARGIQTRRTAVGLKTAARRTALCVKPWESADPRRACGCEQR